MTLLQRERENIELGREEGSISATKILKLHNKGMDNEDISSSYHHLYRRCGKG